MTLSKVTVEPDGELELPPSIVGAVPAGTEFTVEPLIFPGNGTIPERRGFQLVEDLGPVTF